MTEAVEGDMLGDASSLYPVFEVGGNQVRCQFLEHLTLSTLAAQGKCLFADGQDGIGLCLLGGDIKHPSAIARLLDVLPLEQDAVRQTQTRKAGEQTSTA